MPRFIFMISFKENNMLEWILKPLVSKGISTLWENKSTLKLFFYTKFPLISKYRKESIRFSISYLFRIKIPNTNSYLLVLNRRINNQLQPVGGVYKKYGDNKLFEKWEYVPDNKKNGLGIDHESDNDLRFRVRGKYIIDVIEWFESGKEREISANREFYEELVKPKILSEKNFNQIYYKHIRRVSKNLKYSEHHKCYEILIYDIIELLPTQEQSEELIKLAASNNDLENGYAIVDCDDIEQLRYMENGKQKARIGEHTKLIINQNL